MAFIQLGVIASPGSESWLNVDDTQFTKDEATDSLQIKSGALPVALDNTTIHQNGSSQLAVLNSGLPFSQQNYIINPSFQIAQEKTTYTDASSASFNTLDGWGFLRVQSLGQVTIAQTASTTSASGFCHKITVTTTEATTANQTHISFYTIIEGYNSVQLKNGTGLLSFFAKSSKAGTYCVTAMNVNSLYTYIKEYTLAANVRTEINVEFPFSAETAGIWDKTNGNGIVVRWFLKCGVDYQGSPNVWAHVDGYATSNQVNFYDAANTFEIEDVRLVQGTIANYQAIQLKSFQDELIKCQRYYEKSYDYEISPATNTTTGLLILISISATTLYFGHIKLIPKRIATYPVFYTQAGTKNKIDKPGVGEINFTGSVELTTAPPTKYSFLIASASSLFGGVATFYCHWIVDARMII